MHTTRAGNNITITNQHSRPSNSTLLYGSNTPPPSTRRRRRWRPVFNCRLALSAAKGKRRQSASECSPLRMDACNGTSAGGSAPVAVATCSRGAVKARPAAIPHCASPCHIPQVIRHDSPKSRHFNLRTPTTIAHFPPVPATVPLLKSRGATHDRTITIRTHTQIRYLLDSNRRLVSRNLNFAGDGDNVDV